MYFVSLVSLLLVCQFVKAMLVPLRTRQFRGALPLMSRHGSRGPLRMIAMPAFSSSASSSLGSYSWPRGNVLAVGEGDFTFSALLVAHAQARGDFRQGGGCDSIHGASSTQPFQLLATTLDAAVDLPRLYPTSVKRALAELDVAATSSSLPRGAIAVAYGVNATQLEVSPEVTGRAPYDVIRFNFPHVKGKSNSKANRALLTAFLASARPLIKENGVVEVALAEGQGGTGACGERRIGWAADQKRALGRSSGVHKFPFETDLEGADNNVTSDLSLSNGGLAGSSIGPFLSSSFPSVEDAQLMWTRSWQASSCGAEAGLILSHVEPFEAAVVVNNDVDVDEDSLQQAMINDNDSDDGNRRYVPSGRRGRSLGFSPGETPLLHRYKRAASRSDQGIEEGAASTSSIVGIDKSIMKAPSFSISSDVTNSLCESTAALALQHRYSAELHVAVPLDWNDDDLLEEAIRAHLRTRVQTTTDVNQQHSPEYVRIDTITLRSINNKNNIIAGDDVNLIDALDGWSGSACADALVRFTAIHDYVRETPQTAPRQVDANSARSSSNSSTGKGDSSSLNRYRAFSLEFQSAGQPLSKAAAEALWAHVRVAAADFGSHVTDMSSNVNSGVVNASLKECSRRLELRKKSYFGVSKPLPPYLPLDHRMGGAPSCSWVPAKSR